MTEIVASVAELRRVVREWRAAGARVALVPTMGALHAGHLRLVTAGQLRADRVVVSIFVNPTQFAPHEDLARYPRDLEGDLAKLREVGADVAFVPGVEEMYAPGFQTAVRVEVLGQGLCGVSRPHHFGGVATVVAKLLNQAQADVAMFGEKDYQQLLVVRRMALDLDIPTEIAGVATVREEDGLALSSRNRYLTPEQRSVAPKLYREMLAVAVDVAGGAPVAARLTEAQALLTQAGFDRVEYLELRDAASLEPLTSFGPAPARLLAAVHLGAVRLIDNVAVEAVS
ncbi:MAG: pantoate--beta-alanine ligase [Geminicoccaceae bacterium]|nr:MAG: pantoate--beta-alanine ligase [Geminicoccaceae bacterium]